MMAFDPSAYEREQLARQRQEKHNGGNLLALPSPKPEPFDYVSVFKILEQLPPQRFLVEKWIPTGYLTSVYGSGGTGKSFLSMMLAVCVAAGRQWLGYDVEQCNVLVMMCEDDEAEITRRLKKICCGLAVQPQELNDRLFITSRVGEINTLMEYPGGVAARTALFDRVIYEVERTKSRLVILDNAGQIYSGNENDRSQVTAFLNTCAAIAQAIDGAVVLLGHPPKAPNMQFSGSTAWDAVPRSRIWFERKPDEDGAYTLEVAKTSSGTRFGVDLQLNDLGIVEVVGQMDVKKRGRPPKDDEIFNVLKTLFETVRQPIHQDEIVKEAIRVGVLESADELTARWRKRTLLVRRHLSKNRKVDQRDGDTYAIKP